MPRQHAFSFGSLHVHLEAAMASAFPPDVAMPDSIRQFLDRIDGAVHLPLTERLAGLKRLFDEEAARAEARTAA